jgi:hypothetical protein
VSRHARLTGFDGIPRLDGVKDLHRHADVILDRLVEGASTEETLASLPALAVRDGHRERLLTLDDIETVARFLRAARQRVTVLDSQIAAMQTRRHQLAKLLEPSTEPVL